MNNHRPLTIVETALQAAVCIEPLTQQQCGCGKFYYAAGHNTALSLDDLTKLHTAAQETPDRVFPVMERHVMAGEFNGNVIVKGCDCDQARNLGSFLWGNRAVIANYYRIMVAAIEQDAADLRGTLPEAGRL